MRSIFMIVCVAAIMNTSCRNEHRNEIQFWPWDFVIRTESDAFVDSRFQLDALRHADPVEDAKHAYAAGDLRLLSRLGARRMYYLPGVVEDSLTTALLESYGGKVISVNEDLIENQEFVALKEHYEEHYNKTMYQLVSKRGFNGLKGKPSGRR